MVKRNAERQRQNSKYPKSVDQSSGEYTHTDATQAASKASDHSSRSSSSDSSNSFSLARIETLQIAKSKALLLVAILCAACASGFGVYLLTTHQEENAFRTSFHNHALKVVEQAERRALGIVSRSHILATHFTSMISDSGATWPNITIPTFESLGYANNELTQALQVSLAVLVSHENREGWEAYVKENANWIEESYEEQEFIKNNPNRFNGRAVLEVNQSTIVINPEIHRFQNYDHGMMVAQEGPGVSYGPAAFAPIWQQAPAPRDTSIINFDVLSHPVFERAYHMMWEKRRSVLSTVLDLEFFYGGKDHSEQAVYDYDGDHDGNPTSFLLSPVYPTIDIYDNQESDFVFGSHKGEPVAFFVTIVGWHHFFFFFLADDAVGLHAVLHNNCGNHFTYQIDGPEATFLGYGDLHDTHYNDLEMFAGFATFLHNDDLYDHDFCEYELRIYPTSITEEGYKTYAPALHTTIVVLVFVFITGIFCLFDLVVKLRNDKVMKAAKTATAVVSAIFPKNVRDRILQEAEERAISEMEGQSSGFFKLAPKAQLKNFMDKEAGKESMPRESNPLADLYACATVIKTDISGFTAWCSSREPSQIFTFLETIFRSFDTLAKRRRVFKVETVADAYVAVCGLPDPRRDHAVAMARFAVDCQQKFNDLTKMLEIRLGPDTGDLRLRIGLHSGPITAGVLRGDKARFQLFGCTMNTLELIKRKGVPNRIHLSQKTADIISSTGKSHWLVKREGTENLVGLNGTQTYWLELKIQSSPSRNTHSTRSSSDHDAKKWSAAGLGSYPRSQKAADGISEKMQRLIDWNTLVLSQLLTHVVSSRKVFESRAEKDSSMVVPHTEGTMVIDEVVEIIELPQFDSATAKLCEDSDKIDLDPAVVSQLQQYIICISKLYHDNPFHNFEHASHVAMSVGKLLSRIVAPDYLEINDTDSDSGHNVAASLHDHTFGITSDPMTKFACVFAAVIHDVDHQGVPNTQLVKEDAAVASKYKGKSVAEQNSVDMALALLSESRFEQLRNSICYNDEDCKHFRQLVVNGVMATDIVDRDLKVLRNARWEKAFNENLSLIDSPRERINRKATIVIEHLIQASDVSHTMQHWHVYRQWNEAFFYENYKAFKEGRAEKDPTEFWYQAEIGFFDFYIIPLAKKLKDCGVFGVSSDEYLNYAMINRKEWVNQGEAIVEEMVEKYDRLYEQLT